MTMYSKLFFPFGYSIFVNTLLMIINLSSQVFPQSVGVYGVNSVNTPEHFCFFPGKSDSQQDNGNDLCSKKDRTAVWIQSARFKTGKISDDLDCEDLYETEVTSNVPWALRLDINNTCNGKRKCDLKQIVADSNYPKSAYVVIYRCLKIGNHIDDLYNPSINMRKSKQDVNVSERTPLVLSMEVTDPIDGPVDRTCNLTGFDILLKFTVEFLHVDFKEKQEDKCVGQFDLTFDGKPWLSQNCSQDVIKPEGVLSKTATQVQLSVKMRGGILWLLIRGNKTFKVKCTKTKTKNEVVTAKISPDGSSRTEIQPEPTYTSMPMTTTAIMTNTTATTLISMTATTADANEAGESHIAITVVSVIAAIAIIIAVVLVIYLCKTRDSIYTRWKLNRQSARMGAPSPEPSTSQTTAAGTGGDEEYACVNETAIRNTSSYQRVDEPASPRSDEYSMPLDDYMSPLPFRAPGPPVRRLDEEDEEEEVEYANDPQSTVPGTKVNGVKYSHVMPHTGKSKTANNTTVTTTNNTNNNNSNTGATIYSPGFYHTARDKEPIRQKGGDQYDVMNPDSNAYYSHLRDVTKKDNCLRDNFYDG